MQMKKSNSPTIDAAGKKSVFNIRPDAPDIPDRMYEPAPIQQCPEQNAWNAMLARVSGKRAGKPLLISEMMGY